MIWATLPRQRENTCVGALRSAVLRLYGNQTFSPLPSGWDGAWGGMLRLRIAAGA